MANNSRTPWLREASFSVVVLLPIEFLTVLLFDAAFGRRYRGLLYTICALVGAVGCWLFYLRRR
jgi:hypothetical protein